MEKRDFVWQRSKIAKSDRSGEHPLVGRFSFCFKIALTDWDSPCLGRFITWRQTRTQFVSAFASDFLRLRQSGVGRGSIRCIRDWRRTALIHKGTRMQPSRQNNVGEILCDFPGGCPAATICTMALLALAGIGPVAIVSPRSADEIRYSSQSPHLGFGAIGNHLLEIIGDFFFRHQYRSVVRRKTRATKRALLFVGSSGRRA